MTNDDNKRADSADKKDRIAGLLMGLTILPLYFLIDAYEPRRSMATAICASAFATAVYIRWDLRRNVWFWLIILAMGAAHGAVVLYVPWSSTTYHWPELMPVAFLDFALIYGVVKLAEKALSRDAHIR